MLKSFMNGGFSIAMFDYQRVTAFQLTVVHDCHRECGVVPPRCMDLWGTMVQCARNAGLTILQ